MDDMIFWNTLQEFRKKNEGRHLSELYGEYVVLADQSRQYEERHEIEQLLKAQIETVPYVDIIRFQQSGKKIYNKEKHTNFVEMPNVVSEYLQNLVRVSICYDSQLLLDYGKKIADFYNIIHMKDPIYWANRTIEALHGIYKMLSEGQIIHQRDIKKLLDPRFHRIEWSTVFYELEKAGRIHRRKDDGNSYYIQK